MPKRVAYIHIPKTGGTTFSRSLHKYYRAGSRIRINGDHYPGTDTLSSTEKERIMLYEGHFQYGIHTIEGLENLGYITFLRDPYARISSLYYYSKRTPGHYLHQSIISKNMSLAGFADSQLCTELDNDQTRYIAGLRNPGPETCNHETFELALHNIHEKFLAIGILERYHQSVLIMQKMLGTGFLYYQKKNTNQHKNQIDVQALNIIKARNTFDYQLYSYANKQLNEKIKKIHAGEKLLFEIGNCIRLNNFPRIKKAVLQPMHLLPKK